MAKVSIRYGDEFTVEWGYFYVPVVSEFPYDKEISSDLFSSEEVCRQAALSAGHEIDESFDLFGNKK